MEPDATAYTVSLDPNATAEEIAAVREGLHRFNFAATGHTEHHDVTLLVRDGLGTVKGGLLGYVWGGWLHITYLWVSEECRGRGLGGRLLSSAEREASRRGARGAFLSSFDFQAPGFYKRHGYDVYAELPDYPPGHTDYHLRKVF